MASFISMWNRSRDRIEDFLLKANSLHLTIKFAAEISETETTFLYTKVYKGLDSIRNIFLTCECNCQNHRYLSIHEFLFVSPTRRLERLYQRRSVKASNNKFLSI